MSIFPPIEEQLRQIQRGVAEIIPPETLIAKLRQAEQTGTPLRVKLGCDPSRPDLHLGHAVVLRKLRQFQELGHQAILIVGDFTAMIGDPSGRSKTRPPLSFEETRANGQTYLQQATKILHPTWTQMHYNSAWLDSMTFRDVLRLAGTYTVARMLERDDFAVRYRGGGPIGIHELLYPLAQAQDSVAVAADIELGGTDQKFNLLVGRDVQQASGQAPQVCITLPLLVGMDGVEKMSKSLNNYIGLTDAPAEMYGKVLSIPDALISPYFELATDVPSDALQHYAGLAQSDPRNAKHELAWHIVRLYHGADAAQAARQHFERTIIHKEVPEEIETFHPRPAAGTQVPLPDLLRQAGLVASNSEARRLMVQQAVSIDGQKITDPHRVIDLAVHPSFVLKVGKRRFARIVWRSEQSEE
jgi:tyrosyl-tRNA synthetase